MGILRQRLDDNEQGVDGHFSRKHGLLQLREEHQRFYSPSLDLTIDGEGDGEGAGQVEKGHVRVWGTFSPRAEIWTGIIFAIGTLVVLSFLSLIYGTAQLMLGHAPWAFLVPVGALLLAALIWAAGLLGQGLSGEDMYRLRAYVDACLYEAQEGSRRRPTLPPDASSQL